MTVRSRRRRVIVLASGDGSNLQALIDSCETGTVEAEITGVISHTPGAHALERARSAGIPAFCVPITNRKDPYSRKRHEEVLLETLKALKPDIAVLAGWMLVLSRKFLGNCHFPILNVHPALLSVEGMPLDIPVLKGAHAVRDALELNLPYTGVSIHLVTEEVDGGPVLLREHVEIVPGDDEISLYARLKPVEHRLLISAMRSFVNSQLTPRTPQPTLH